MNKMYRTLKNMLQGKKKVKDECGATHRSFPDSYLLGHSQTYHRSLEQFIILLRRGREDGTKSVTWRETVGWEPRVKFSWDKPRSFSPREAANYIEERHLLSDVWNHFESLWQIYARRGQEQHYFDIHIYDTTFPMGSVEIGELKHKITLEYLLTKE